MGFVEFLKLVWALQLSLLASRGQFPKKTEAVYLKVNFTLTFERKN